MDRKYYLKSLQNPLMALFLPIVKQRRNTMDDKACIADTEHLLFDITKRRAWKHNVALRAACMANSPIFLAFAKQMRCEEASESPPPKKPKK